MRTTVQHTSLKPSCVPTTHDDISSALWILYEYRIYLDRSLRSTNRSLRSTNERSSTHGLSRCCSVAWPCLAQGWEYLVHLSRGAQVNYYTYCAHKTDVTIHTTSTCSQKPERLVRTLNTRVSSLAIFFRGWLLLPAASHGQSSRIVTPNPCTLRWTDFCMYVLRRSFLNLTSQSTKAWSGRGARAEGWPQRIYQAQVGRLRWQDGHMHVVFQFFVFLLVWEHD